MKFLVHLFKRTSDDRYNVYREWDRLRNEAMTPSHRSEIDAIFSRSV